MTTEQNTGTAAPYASADGEQTPEQIVERCRRVLAHAWMVRTFIKHSDEVEDFPELMGIVRAVFDTTRALETRGSDPAGFLHMLRKKLGKLKTAAAQFREDAPQASTHTNFEQAVLSMDTCVEDLELLLAAGTAAVKRAAG